MDSITSKAFNILFAYNHFRYNYALLKKSQYWEDEEIEKYQLKKLKKLINHSYSNVPYYKRIFDENGLKPTDIKKLDDIEKIPFLTKEIIQENFNDFKALNYSDKDLEYVTTSGSSGIPFGFYYEKGVSRAIEWAYIKTMWDRVGYHFRDKCVVLRGNVIGPDDPKKLWQKTFFNRWLLMSSFKMNDNNMGLYIEKIREFKPKFIQAYPSAILNISQFMAKDGIEPFSSVKAVLCGSEKLFDWQREVIEKQIGCRVYSWYGQSEQTVIAGECEESNYYHIFPEYGIFELIDESEVSINKSGIKGEIVGTNLDNFVFPLIRYRTRDIASLREDKCSCGRNNILLETVEGRLQEYIVTKRGRYVSISALNIHSTLNDVVERFQFYQDKEGELTFKFIPTDSYSDQDGLNIKKELLDRFGGDVELEIELVDKIERTSSGKYKYLIQNLPIDLGDL